MSTLSQTGSLFKPSSAYLPQELLGKVRHGPFLFFPFMWGNKQQDKTVWEPHSVRGGQRVLSLSAPHSRLYPAAR